MKAIVLSLSLVVLYTSFSPVFSQKTPIDRLIKKYEGREGILSINVPSFRILAVEEDALTGDFDFYNDVKASIRRGNYKEVFSVREQNQKVIILVKNEKEKMTELLMIIGGEENVALSIIGEATSSVIEAVSGFLSPGQVETLREFQSK